MKLLKNEGIDDVLVFAGGIIPQEDIPALKRIGIKEIFGPGTPTGTLVKFVQENAKRKK